MGSRFEDADELKQLKECLKLQSLVAAEAALKHYNDTQNVQYVLEKPLNSNALYVCRKDGIHVNFLAKKKVGEGDDPSSSPSELFFAEGYYIKGWRRLRIRCCVIVDPEETDTGKVIKECRFCSKDFRTPIFHDVEHYSYGKYDEDDYLYVDYSDDDWDDVV